MRPASTPKTIRPVLRFANLYQDVGLECFPGKVCKEGSAFTGRVIGAHKQTFVSKLTDVWPGLGFVFSFKKYSQIFVLSTTQDCTKKKKIKKEEKKRKKRGKNEKETEIKKKEKSQHKNECLL